MLTPLVLITMVVSHAHVILVKNTMMIALILTNVLPISTNVTMLPPIPIPSVHTSVLAWLVMKELDVNVPTLTNVPLVHTLVLVIRLSAMIKLQVSTADVSTNVSISMAATMPLIDAMTMPPVEIPLVATHVNAILVSLMMDSNVLTLINAMITDGLVMDSLVLITTNAKTVFNG